MRATRRSAMALLVFLLAACGGGSDGSASQEEAAGAALQEDEPDIEDEEPVELVDVRWGVAVRVPTPAQAPYSSVPQALGYWEEEGLNVEVQGFDGSGPIFQAIDAGQLDVGQGPPSALFPAMAQGADMVAFYDHIPGNFLVPAVPEDSDIQTVEDFKGKTIGVASLGAGGVPLVKAMVQDAGISLDEVDIVVIGTGAEAASHIKRGEVDIISLWDSAYAQLETMGIPLRIVASDKFMNLGFHNAIVASSEMMAEHRDALIGLGRGVAKATVFAKENPEAVVRINWEVYPESKPTGVSEEEALEKAVVQLKARNENTRATDGVWGYSTEEIIRQHVEVLLEAGVIEGDVDVEELWNGELLEEINDFDAEAIREQARNYEH